MLYYRPKHFGNDTPVIQNGILLIVMDFTRSIMNTFGKSSNVLCGCKKVFSVSYCVRYRTVPALPIFVTGKSPSAPMTDLIMFFLFVNASYFTFPVIFSVSLSLSLSLSLCLSLFSLSPCRSVSSLLKLRIKDAKGVEIWSMNTLMGYQLSISILLNRQAL